MDRREFLKLLPQWLVYRLLPASTVAALTACDADEGSGTVQIDPNLELYTPLVGTATSKQAAWFRSAIGQSGAPRKVVVVHDPPYSSGRTHGSQEHARWPFKEWGASVVISGNDHTYERLLVDGLPYFVNGLGGGRIYEFDEDEIVPESLVRFNEDYGAMLVEADAGRIHFQFITAPKG